MSAKRGRPLSGESDSVTVNHRRQQVRERMRRLRQRQRATDNYTTTTTIAQSQQCENIISLPSVAEEEAAATLLSLGLRKSSDLEIAEDPLDARLQESALDVDEHTSLYGDGDRYNRHVRRPIQPPAAGFFVSSRIPGNFT